MFRLPIFIIACVNRFLTNDQIIATARPGMPSARLSAAREAVPIMPAWVSFRGLDVTTAPPAVRYSGTWQSGIQLNACKKCLWAAPALRNGRISVGSRQRSSEQTSGSTIDIGAVMLRKITTSQNVAGRALSASAAGRPYLGLNGAAAPLLLAALVSMIPAVASAQSCGEEIASLETQMKLGPAAPLSAHESVDATLHHQPTVGSVSAATRAAEDRLERALARARSLRARGKDSQCLATLKTVDPALGGS
jgi:hypothetical protein